MSYNKGQSQFGRGNIWAALKQTVLGETGVNASDQFGFGPAQHAKFTYDFAVNGGAQTTILLGNQIIPAGAIIYGGLINGITLPVGPGASIAIGLGSGAQAAALKAATAIATYAAGAIVALIPVWTAASAFRVAADTLPSVTISGAALTAGKFSVDIYYHMTGE
jgi:hypothetical protein